MTDDQITGCYAALGQAFAERRELRKKLDVIKFSLETFAEQLGKAVNDPSNTQARPYIENADDPREQWLEYKDGVRRLAELDKILSE